uniref:Odorant receptor n=1 Tax=Eriocrania semipurpurella TaxID=41180 RepID=A0A2H4NTA7_9NEOP|nr:odorant receptor 4 [Eriocrania semipurpurella]
MICQEKMDTAMIPLQRVLSLGLIWPTEIKPDRTVYLANFFYRWYSIAFYFLVPIMETSYAIQHINDMRECTEAACTLFTAIVVEVKLFYLLIYQETLKYLIRTHLQKDYTTHMPFLHKVQQFKDEKFSELNAYLEDTMDKDLKQCRLLFISLVPSVVGTLILYQMVPALTMWYTSVYNPDNYELLLPFRFALPFDYEDSTALYTFAYSIHIMAGWLTGHGFIYMDVIFGMVMVMMIRQCEVLARVLRDQHKYAVILAGEGATPKQIDDQSYDLLSQWIVHYERILMEHSKIEALGPVFFSQFSGATLTICLLAFKADMESHPALLATYFLHFVSTAVQLMIYCWYGERLFHVGQNLAEVAYQTPWEERSGRYQHALRMVIRQGHRYPRLTAIGFWELSLPTYRAIFGTAASYYTLLQSVGEEKE